MSTINRWNKCEVCVNKVFIFSNATQFSQHLRDYHSTKEGGSYVCRYGVNNICSSLPLEGVSDHDFEAHIYKCHINVRKAKTSNDNYENGVVIKPKARQKRLDLFPLAANSESVLNNSSDARQQPNVVSDGITKWNVYSSSQNLASVLNDPSKPRSYSESIFTKDWGTYFIDSGSVPQSPFIAKITHTHFDTYIKKVLKRAKVQRNRVRSESVSLQTQSQTRSVDNFVPKIFFNPDFSLENVDTFKTVLSFCTNSEVLLQKPHLSSSKYSVVSKDAMRELQRNFSEYLDIVEENLARQIRIRSKDFFQVMFAMETIMDQLKKTIKEVTLLRKKCEQLELSLIKPSLKNIQLTKTRNTAKDILSKINLMSTVHQTQPTIQLLLSTLDFVGALDLISTSQDVVDQELSGIHSFRHLKLQLLEIEKVIDQMMREEFTKYLTSEWNRPLNLNDEKYLIEEDRLLAIIYGMLRLQRFNFIDAFRDEANTAIKAVVKQTVIETLSNEDNLEVRQRYDGSLFDQLRDIEFTTWLKLLVRVFDNLYILLKRVHAVYNVMCNGFSAISDHNYNETRELDATSTEGSVDTIKLLMKIDYIELSANLKEALCSICDFAHIRCANVIESRAKEGVLDKLTSNEFVELIKYVQLFTNNCQQLSGRRSPNLKLVLQTQANKFATRFHEERKKKLNLLLDIEQWKSIDAVNSDFQFIVSQIIEKKVKFNDIEKLKTIESEQKHKMSFILVNGQKFVIVSAVITLVNMIIEYCQCAQEITTLSQDLLTRLLDLLKLFNSRTAQLVLGAGALQVAGLKTITARKLIISSRCLQFVLVFIPYTKSHFESLLPPKGPKQQSMCKHFDDITQSYKEHIVKIPEKVITVVRELADSQLTKWEAKPPVPSAQFLAISQHLMRLHENIHDAMPLTDLVDLFKRIHQTFKEVLRIHLERLKVKNDGGPQHGLVTQELTFYTQNLRKLGVAKHINFLNEDLWQK